MTNLLKALVFVLTFGFCMQSLAQETAAPAPGQEAAAGSAASVPIDPASVMERVPGKKIGEGIPFVTGRGPTLFDKSKALNRMRLQAQNVMWEGLDELSAKAITYDEPDLLKFGHWYRALLAGHNEKPEEALAHLKVAMQYGYKNAQAMLSNEALLILQDRDDFQSLVADLAARLDREMRENFRAFTDQAFAGTGLEVPAWLAEIPVAAGEPLFKPGRPMLVVLARIHHDGFPKIIEVLSRVQDSREAPVPVGVIFCQYSPRDSARIAQTERYAEDLGLRWPWAVIGWEPYNALTSMLMQLDGAVKKALAAGASSADDGDELTDLTFFNYFPVTVFFDGTGTPLHALTGIPADWQLTYAVEKFADSVEWTREEAAEEAVEEAEEAVEEAEEAAEAVEEAMEEAVQEAIEEAAEEAMEEATEEAAEEAVEDVIEEAVEDAVEEEAVEEAVDEALEEPREEPPEAPKEDPAEEGAEEDAGSTDS